MRPVTSARAIRCILLKRDRCFWFSPSSINCFGGEPRGPPASSDRTDPPYPGLEPSGAAGDLAGLDVENLPRSDDAGECRGVGTGHPHLRAEFCQLIEQRVAPF